MTFKFNDLWGALSSALAHIGITSGNPHNVSKADVGLGSVDDIADLDKPISTATQTALNNKQNLPTGTPDGTKFLRDDNSWQALPSSSGTITVASPVAQATVEFLASGGSMAGVTQMKIRADVDLSAAGVLGIQVKIGGTWQTTGYDGLWLTYIIGGSSDAQSPTTYFHVAKLSAAGHIDVNFRLSGLTTRAMEGHIDGGSTTHANASGGGRRNVAAPVEDVRLWITTAATMTGTITFEALP